MLFWHMFGSVAVCIIILVSVGLTLSHILGEKDKQENK